MARVITGVPGLDEMLRGGLMRGDAVMVAGNAGSGKTTLGLQYLVNGATRFGENGIYVTFEELPDQLYRDAANFGWDLKKLEAEQKLRVICTSPTLLLESEQGEGLLDQPIKRVAAKRIVIDSLSHLGMFHDEKELRLETYRLIMYLKRKGLTPLLSWETPQMIGQSFSITDLGLSFLVDSIIVLKFVEIESSMKRAIMVSKMRGSDHDALLRQYRISKNGVVVELPFEGYESILSGAPRRVESNVEKFRHWLERQPSKIDREDLGSLCERVLRIDGIRYCAARDALGNVLAGGQKSGVRQIQTPEEERDTFYRVGLMGATLASMPPSFGRPQVLSMRLERIRVITLPFGEGVILFVTAERDAPSQIIDRIQAVVKRHEK